jgi:hypothetical protein
MGCACSYSHEPALLWLKLLYVLAEPSLACGMSDCTVAQNLAQPRSSTQDVTAESYTNRLADFLCRPFRLYGFERWTSAGV